MNDEWCVEFFKIDSLLILDVIAGLYGVLVPFFNSIFSGKIARFQTEIGPNFIPIGDMSADVQELNIVVDRERPNTYRGFRGGFVSMWPGALF